MTPNPDPGPLATYLGLEDLEFWTGVWWLKYDNSFLSGFFDVVVGTSCWCYAMVLWEVLGLFWPIQGTPFIIC